MLVPIPFVGWMHIDFDETEEESLREQLRAQQVEIATLKQQIAGLEKLVYGGTTK